MGEVLYVVMPAYNEAENICNSVEEWYKVLEGKDEESRLVVADAGSTDDTHKLLTELMDKLPKLVVLEDTLKQHGPKLIALYNYAITMNADYVFQTDSDGQTNPKEFEKFWSMKADKDAVFGFRRKRGDGLGRLFVEKVLCLIIRAIFGVDVPDANAPFRLMRCDSLEEYMGRFKEDFSLPNVMIVAFFKYYKKDILFEEISFESRKAGKNSINIRKICSIGLKSIMQFYDFKKGL